MISTPRLVRGFAAAAVVTAVIAAVTQFLDPIPAVAMIGAVVGMLCGLVAFVAVIGLTPTRVRGMVLFRWLLGGQPLWHDQGVPPEIWRTSAWMGTYFCYTALLMAWARARNGPLSG